MSQPPFDLDAPIQERLCAVHDAFQVATGRPATEEFVPLDQSRTLLRLFMQVRDDDLRQTILDLLRALAQIGDGVEPVSSGAPSAHRRSGASTQEQDPLA